MTAEQSKHIHISFWVSGSDEAWQTVESLVKSRRYLHALFFCHLAIEKLLKSKFVQKHDKAAPPVHDLFWLCNESDVKLTDEQKSDLAEINKFNIAGRYDDYKLSMHKQATPEFTKVWVEKTRQILNDLG